MDNILLYSISFVIYIFSIVLHEVAHGAVAYLLGDPTAKDAGRLTLNPISHIDPIGTILIPIVSAFIHIPLIGWAKPVPYNPMYFKNIRQGTFFVSAAGIGANLSLAIIFGLLIRTIMASSLIQNSMAWQGALHIFTIVTFANLALGIFNLLPIPPLDGAKIFWSLSTEGGQRIYYFLEQFGFFILLFLIYAVPSFSNYLFLFIAQAFAFLTGIQIQ